MKPTYPQVCRCTWRGHKRIHVCALCPALVIIESPFTGDRAVNVEYAKDCLRDSLRRGEAPLVSHLLYPQVLDDMIPHERVKGIEAGLAWGLVADLTAVYEDLGISGGMQKGIERARRQGRNVEFRRIRYNPTHFQEKD